MNAINSINSSFSRNINKNNVAFSGNKDLLFVSDKELTMEDMEKAIHALHTIEDKFEVKEKKSKAGVAVSLAAGAVALFAIGKSGYKKGAKAVSAIVNNDKIQKATKQISEKLNSSDNALAKYAKGLADNVQKYINKGLKLVSDKAISKVGGAANAAGIATAVIGTTCVARTDSNEDGVADIAQKGINAYKETVQRMGVVGDLIDALT